MKVPKSLIQHTLSKLILKLWILHKCCSTVKECRTVPK